MALALAIVKANLITALPFFSFYLSFLFSTKELLTDEEF